MASQQNRTERPAPVESEGFNSTEVAQIIGQQSGWSGRAMIWAFQAAIDFQKKQTPELEPEQIGELLVKAYSAHKAEKGKYAVNPQKFFEQGLYCDAPERAAAKTRVFDDNPATRALAQMEDN